MKNIKGSAIQTKKLAGKAGLSIGGRSGRRYVPKSAVKRAAKFAIRIHSEALKELQRF